MVINVFVCEQCNLAFQVETETVLDELLAEHASTPRPPCPQCENPRTVRMYQVPGPAAECKPGGSC